MSQPKYKIQVYNVSPTSGAFSLIEEITTYQSLSFSRISNSVGNATFSMNVSDPKLTSTLFTRYKSKVVLMRNDVPVWIGFVYKKSLDYSPDSKTLNIVCYDYVKLFEKRVTKDFQTFNTETTGDIIWSLINDSQNESGGGLGVQRGVDSTTTTKDRTYQKYTILSNAIINMANVENGYDFQFTPILGSDNLIDHVNFDSWDSRSTFRDGFTLVKSNIDQMSATDYVEIANTVLSSGSGTGEGVLDPTAENSGLQNSYGRLEEVLLLKDTSTQDTLQDTVDDYLTTNSRERYYMSIKLRPDTAPQYGDFDLEDVIKYDFTTFSQDYLSTYGKGTAKVKNIQINIDSVGAEFIYPYLDF